MPECGFRSVPIALPPAVRAAFSTNCFVVIPNGPGRMPFAPTVCFLGNRGCVIRIWDEAIAPRLDD
jgi:hypothetical protein